MRLLFLSNLYPPYDIGGYEQICQEMAAFLAKQGHQVRILTSNYGVAGSHAAMETPAAGISVRRSLHLEADLHFYRPLDFFVHRNRRERQNLAAVDREIAAFDPDLAVVFGMWNLSLRIPKRLETQIPGKVAYYICSYWPQDLDAHRQYWRLPERKKTLQLMKPPLARLALSRLDREDYPPALDLEHVRCVSRFVRNTLVQAGRIPEESGVLYLGIDIGSHGAGQSFSQADSKLRLLYFGSLFTHKGVHTALEALSILKARGLADDLELTILGSGHASYEQHLREMVRAKGMETLVGFVPRVPYAQVPGYLKQHDIFLFTSTWDEPLARTVMEAMAAGLFVIATRVGGEAEMLEHGGNAFTFPAGDAQTLAGLIDRARKDPERRRAMALSGQRLVETRFTLDRMGQEFEAWLDEISNG